MTRISDLGELPFHLQSRPREGWKTGDYVAVGVLDAPASGRVELVTGRFVDLVGGEVVVGALGHRYATLEATGSWEEVGSDGMMEILTGGGLLGRCTSRSSLIPPLTRVRYMGHVVRDGRSLGMLDFVPEVEGFPAAPSAGLHVPSVMIIGTSMSAGKTATARVVTRRLLDMGQRVMAAKLTGAGRYRDILTMRDSGADPIFDFMDMGLPSTVCPAEEYGRALEGLLVRMSRASVDLAVIEVGASPMEPYNGDVAVRRIMESVRLTILCASDPYSVVGLMEAFQLTPDLVTGITSNTWAGVELVEKLTGVLCLNIRDPRAVEKLDTLLENRLLKG